MPSHLPLLVIFIYYQDLFVRIELVCLYHCPESDRTLGVGLLQSAPREKMPASPSSQFHKDKATLRPLWKVGCGVW